MAKQLSFYIAASWPRRQEAVAISSYLVSSGYKSTARWINESKSQGYEHGVSGMTGGLPEQDEHDVRVADCLVCLTGDTLTRGGRHTELGIAIALGKRVFCVGPMEQVFHRHPLVTMVNDISELLRAMRDVVV